MEVWKKLNLATDLCWWYTNHWKWWHDDRSYDKKIEREFCIQGIGDLNYFLGIAIKRDCGGMHLCQAKYIQDVLNKMNMADCKWSPTPMSSCLRYSQDVEEDEGGRAFEGKTLYMRA